MIYSSAVDNWHRIKLMHSIAKDLYELTRENLFRNMKGDLSEGFYFDANAFLAMQKETCIVEMIMSWCVITLESQVNHAIAATESGDKRAINAIEYPTKSKGARSGLARKLLILSKRDQRAIELISLADELSDIRNEIVHDKPFEFIDRGDGDVDVRFFRDRGDSEGRRYNFENLEEYYKKCQKICGFIDEYYVCHSPMGDRVNFTF